MIPDATLGIESSIVVPETAIRDRIDGGAIRGANLFHSFQELNVQPGRELYFSNPAGVNNIFTRVIGSNISNIDGVLGVSGTANLFLLNPKGFLFGANASLDLKAGLFVTSANQFKFADGSEFSATQTEAPLLTMSAPVGVQFGSNPGTIELQGATLTFQPNQSIVLLGGDILQSGGEIATNGGNIAYGSVQQSGIVPFSEDWKLDFSGIQNFGDIQMRDRAIAMSRGEGGGRLQFHGRQITLRGLAYIASDTIGTVDGKDATITASELLEVSDATEDGDEFSMIYIGTQSTGNGGSLNISAPIIRSDMGSINLYTSGDGNTGALSITTQQLVLTESAQIGTSTYGAGNAGDVIIKADRIDISGFYASYESPINGIPGGFFIYSSGLFTQVERAGTGNGGNLTVETGTLRVADGGRVSTSVEELGSGNAGNLTIRANEVIVDGVTLNERGAYSGILANVQNTDGNSGTMRIDTNRLTLLNGGQISASNLGTGQAGDIEINARSIDISGFSSDLNLPSRISATSASNLPAGSIRINAETLDLNNQGTISVSSLGSGDAGNLTINARYLRLSDRASLQSEVRGGTQGDINLTIADAILLRRGSEITTNALETASGGNIRINTANLIGLENSDIVANAIAGNGGNIQITTQSILGSQLSDRRTLNSDISASSEFGIDGNIEVTSPSVDPNSGVTALPVEVLDPSQQIVEGCTPNTSRFVITGKGGLPEDPTQRVNHDRVWNDLRSVQSSVSSIAPVQPSLLVEATGWKRDRQGKVVLVTDNFNHAAPQNVTCAGF